MLISTFAMMPVIANAEPTDESAGVVNSEQDINETVETQPVDESSSEADPQTEADDTEASDGSTETEQSEISEEDTATDDSVVNTANPAVNYTNVAPFLPAVEGKTSAIAKTFSLMASTARTISYAANYALESEDQEEQEDPDNGLELSKTVSDLDANGKGTITLEAYATGATTTTTTQEEVPTDIVLVLDQSGSMDKSITSYTDEYTQYTTNTNSSYYNNSNNIWYKDGDTYVKVKVTRVEKGSEDTYKEPLNYRNGTLKDYADKGNLYIKVGETYKQVRVTRKRGTYTYSADGVNSKTSQDRDTIVSDTLLGYSFYVKSTETVYTYTYTYTNVAGETVTMTSEGESVSPVTEAFYQRGTTTTTRLNALKTAVTNFTNSVAEKAQGADKTFGTDDDINHRIAVVGFGSGDFVDDRVTDYVNTELFIGSTQYSYPGNVSGQYANAFQNMNTQSGYDNVIASKDALDANGGTYVDLGIEMANGIFKANPLNTGEKRNRVVIVFTDGAPGYNGTWSGASYGYSGDAKAVANEAISNAYKTKNGYSATVYTVGIFEGANPEGNDNPNIYMNYVSSNYKNATSMDSSGDSTKPDDSSYYLSAGDADTLNDIFQLISGQIESGGSSIELDEEAVIKDVMSDYFVLPEGTKVEDIVVKTATVSGKNEDGYTFNEPESFENAEVAIDGNTVTVTNFNFKDNYVGTDTTDGEERHRGTKLIIEIPVQVREGFWGGNGVPTNGEGSGVYENADKAETGESIEDFISPETDVPINIPKFSAADVTVYYGNPVSVDDLYVPLALEESEKWKDDFVTVSYDTPETVDSTECGEYVITVTLTPINAGTVSEASSEATSKVHVLVPQITYQDSEIYLGEIADYDDNTLTDNIAWIEPNAAHSSIPDVSGTAPVLTLEYNPEEAAFDEDTPVNVSVKIGETYITDAVFFKNGDSVHRGDASDSEFTVKVKTCTLKIDKEITGAIDKNQSFIFTVKGDATNRYSGQVDITVVVQEDGEAIVTGLPVGNYTVTEQTDWSWRYMPKNNSQEVTLSKDTTTSGEVEFANDRTKDKWLNGNAYTENIFNPLNSEAGSN